MASLLDSVMGTVGDDWWIHLEDHEKRTEFVVGDVRRNWRKACVRSIVAGCMEVKLAPLADVDDPQGRAVDVRSIPISTSSLGWQELLELAHRSLCCMEWSQVTKDLLTGHHVISATRPDVTESTLLRNNRCRPVARDELIDYFISHSWHDDGLEKFAVMHREVATFQRRRGRTPTFWLDKTCIDQASIADGLRALPVCVMRSSKMLMLLGASYPHRLWCVWELFTLMAFTSKSSAVQRLEVRALGREDATALCCFDLSDVGCYDPNEERRLRIVIGSIGAEQFTNRIRDLGAASQSRTTSQTARPGGLAAVGGVCSRSVSCAHLDQEEARRVVLASLAGGSDSETGAQGEAEDDIAGGAGPMPAVVGRAAPEPTPRAGGPSIEAMFSHELWAAPRSTPR